MSDATFTQLQDQCRQGGAAAVFEQLAQTLRDKRDFHKLFDALCLKKKYELGAPLHRPTSFDDVPAEKRDEFEAAYIAAAREVANLLLKDNKLGQSFVYFHALRETQPLRDAIEAIELPQETSEQSEELIDLAFYKLLHPVKGMQIMLRTHGTCSTITSLDQAYMSLTPEQRSACAALLVRTLHADLLQSLQREVQQKIPVAAPVTTLKELTAGREWLFAENNYHIDVSHLHSTVRFARSLSPTHPDLPLALDLAEYGVQLSPQFQYPGEPPFTEFYAAHIQFFKYLLNDNRDEALAYFQRQLENEADSPSQAMIAYVMVDLLARTEQLDKALPIAEKYLVSADHDFAAAFAELCEKAGRFDVLLRNAEQRSDLVTYAAALVQQK
ncbi:hypothetical protein [Schlesneria sp. T3-172]|uniref:hypothetical protein n=1 Tax=Schlesneria sphaerica TaxID=3373610 RepID=UPI0037C63E98